MSFGVHLLAGGLARSDTEVVRILQEHVDEMDGFLERTAEDLSLIELDVETRIQYLRLPLDNLDVFDGILTDTTFRISVAGYNDKIKLSIERFGAAVVDLLKDVGKGMEGVRKLWIYLGQLAADSALASGSLGIIYEAMLGNVNGWNVALSRLHKRGSLLDSTLTHLDIGLSNLQRRVGVAHPPGMFIARSVK